MRLARGLVACGVWIALGACGEAPSPTAGAAQTGAPEPAPAPPAPPDLDRALLLGLSVFPPGPEGGPSKTPGAASLLILRREGGEWRHEVLEDPESNVFHKAIAFTPPGRPPGILTIAGNQARLRLWRRGERGWEAETLWAPVFGGKHNRLRDMELADLDRDGSPEIVLATHDQGVVSVVSLTPSGVDVRELDRSPETFVHEIEVGDIDGDGTLDILATPSQPNRFNDEPQPGRIVRYTPTGERRVFADLGDRHAKEVLVTDLDGDGRPEVYASVEGHAEKGVRVSSAEVRRFPPAGGAGESVAALDDLLCRFLAPGDVDGDGRREIVASGFRSGVWLLRPGAKWTTTRIDADSSSFEHATALLDLDGDGKDEIYVAADDQHAVRRYVWTPEGFGREEIFRFPPELRGFTWNITAVPAELTR